MVLRVRRNFNKVRLMEWQLNHQMKKKRVLEAVKVISLQFQYFITKKVIYLCSACLSYINIRKLGHVETLISEAFLKLFQN